MNTPRVPLVLTAVAYLFLIAAVLSGHGWDPSHFINPGDKYNDPRAIPGHVSVQPKSDGYDGQFYYRLALDPFTREQTAFGMTLDRPVYRQQRIFYPFMVWALSWGRPHLIPAVMIAVNYLALCGLAWVGARFAQSVKQHALWGLAFPGYAGFVLTLAKDLAEILTGFLLLQALWLLRRGRQWMAAVLLTLAVLSRETALLVAIGVLGDVLINRAGGRRSRAHAWPVFLMPLLVWALWQWMLLTRWGALPSVSGHGNIGMPLVGFINLLRSVSGLHTSTQQRWFFELCFIAAFAVSVLHALRASTGPRYETISWLLYLTLAAFMTSHVWVEDWAFLRALTELYVLGVVVLLSSASRIKFFILPWAMGVWLLVFRSIVQF